MYAEQGDRLKAKEHFEQAHRGEVAVATCNLGAVPESPLQSKVSPTMPDSDSGALTEHNFADALCEARLLQRIL